MKSFFLILLLITVSSFGTLMQAHVSHTSEKEVLLKGGDVGAMRTPVFHSVRAFIESDRLLIKFYEPIGDVEVNIVNVQTGEVCYSQTSDAADHIGITLSGMESGEYRLELSLNAGATLLYGDFIL